MRFKKSFHKMCPFVLLLCLYLIWVGTSAVSASEIVASGDRIGLYIHKTEALLTENYRAVRGEDGNLYVMDRSDKVLLVLQSGYRGGVAFGVKNFYVGEKCFWEIIADVGAHGKNCGYWLIGRDEEIWRIFLSINELAENGYTLNEWHQIHSKFEDGRYFLRSRHEYMPPGAVYQYQRKFETDWEAEIIWDEETGMFVVCPLELE